MPQCICGCFFSGTSYDVENREKDLCPKCIDSSTPKSYTSSYTYTCGNLTGSVIEVSGNTNWSKEK